MARRSKASSSTIPFVELVPDRFPGYLGPKPLSLHLWVAEKTSKFSLRVFAEGRKKSLKFALVDPEGNERLVKVKTNGGMIKEQKPFSGIWEIRSAESEARFVRVVPEEGAILYCHPHHRSLLTIRPLSEGQMDLYLEAPQGMERFQLTTVGGAQEFALFNEKGKPIPLEPINKFPFLAWAKDRFVFTVSLKGSSRQILRLQLKHSNEQFTINTRERLRFFFAPPPQDVPLCNLEVTTEDENGEFIPSWVSIFRGEQWWRGIFTRHPKEKISLPPGGYLFHADHGMEYLPDRKFLELGRKNSPSLTFRLKRGLTREKGWYCGDSHNHSTCSDGVGTIPEMFHAAEACGLDWIAITDHANSGYTRTVPEGLKQVRRVSAHSRVIGIPGVETCSFEPMDDLCALNIREYIYAEVQHRDPDTGELVKTRKSPKEIFKEVESQSSPNSPTLCVVAHPLHSAFEGEKVLTQCKFFRVFEGFYGNIVSSTREKILSLWFRLLNEGRRLASVADTDSHFFDFYPPGSQRVYCYMEGKPTRKKIIEAIGEGKSFCTNGPLLLYLKVNEKISGEDVLVKSFPCELAIDLKGDSLIPFERVELIFNGEVKKSWEVSREVKMADDWNYPVIASSAFQFEIAQQEKVDSPGWCLAVAYIKGEEGPFAFTNPIYIRKRK